MNAKSLLLSGAFLLAALPSSQANDIYTTPFTIDIQATIDGRDELIVQGDQIYWHHVLGAAPTGSVTITTTMDGVTQLDHVVWTPQWSVDPSTLTDVMAYSLKFEPLFPTLGTQPEALTIEKLQGRGTVDLLEYPTTLNGGNLFIGFDDSEPGTDLYEVFIDVTPVPEPYSIGVAGVALAGFALWRRQRGKKA
ncbi:MAG TPA: PEP-CTERM sorting domain-containing protein [Candidatus Limnocylindria bacterium]|nr:PEP-CTERM sorting domain-containing protein [Candidatus Limnocylindria bacterium]